jgi:N-acetyl-alpha-D-muramate 1-phosphate uridylyltransferase
MKINTALILCAGHGKRLNPLTFKTPKPLLKINDKTLLENTIKLIVNLGIHKIKLNTFYLKEQIEAFVINQNFKMDIEIIDDGEKILNTGGGISNMIDASKEEDFLVFNPDTIWNDNYLDCIKHMEEFYFLKKIENILMVVNKDLSFDKSLIGDFNCVENKLKKNEFNEFIFTGCQIISKNLFKDVKSKSFSILEIWIDLIKKDRLFAFESKSEFYHVTNLEIYQKLLKN